MQLPMPSDFHWQSPPICTPLRAVGANVVDVNHQVVANCPNGSVADAIAYTINVALGVHAPAA